MSDRTDEETLRILSESIRRSEGAISALWTGGSLTRPLPRGPSFVVGRGRQADVSLEHASLSRRHVEIALTEAGAQVTDLGSANGTRVRGQALAPRRPASVAWGEPFELGKVVATLSPPRLAAPLPPSGGAAPPVPMQEVQRLIEVVARTDMGVLLLGETGVGKGFWAERIHRLSKRSGGPWLHLNCAALPEALLESELFGYARGAFTGASQDKPGLLESASGGTVFLDEIGEMPLGTQAKLLLAIEQGHATPLGATKPRPFDTRFLSATNRSLEALSDPARFRQDLFYRLAGLPIVIPPLRERPDELVALARELTARAAHDLGRPAPRLAPDFERALAAHAWPGNIRELGLVVQRALLFGGAELGREQLEAALTPERLARSPGLNAGRPGETAPSPPVALPQAPGERPLPLHEEIRATERARILEALARSANDMDGAAAALGLTRRALMYKIDTLGLPRPRKGRS